MVLLRTRPYEISNNSFLSDSVSNQKRWEDKPTKGCEKRKMSGKVVSQYIRKI